MLRKDMDGNSSSSSDRPSGWFGISIINVYLGSYLYILQNKQIKNTSTILNYALITYLKVKQSNVDYIGTKLLSAKYEKYKNHCTNSIYLCTTIKLLVNM